MPDPPHNSDLIDAISGLRAELAQLEARLATLESHAAEPLRAEPISASQPKLQEQTLATISAVLAAHFGVRPRIRQVRLVGGESWVHQGRVTIQASHVLDRH
jgi:methylmalonyl-CoA carboxyltransferase 12S subunit